MSSSFTAHRLADLDTEAVICLPEGTGIRAALDRACRSEIPELRVDLEASSPDTVIGLAARGLGVAILSASMVEGQAGLSSVPLAEPGVQAQLGLVWKSQENVPAATQALLTAMTSALIGGSSGGS